MTQVLFGLMAMVMQISEHHRGTFLGLEATEHPRIIWPGVVSTALGEYNGTFSPDGKAFYYTVSAPGYDAIVVMRMKTDGIWTDPQIAPFSGKYPDFDPLFSPDGTHLYFSSRRPLGGEKGTGQSRIWVMSGGENGWSKPVCIPLVAESAYYSSLTRDGKLYFNTNNGGVQDIYCAKPSEGGYRVTRLGEAVNGPHTDVDPFVSPDESFLIFRSFRPGGLGGADLYISFRREGEWQPAVNLGSPINSAANESCPWVSTEKKLFIFASNRLERAFYHVEPSDLRHVLRKAIGTDNGQLNLYYTGTAFLEKLKPDRAPNNQK